MIFQIIGTVFVALVLYLFKYWYIEPKRIMKGYTDFLKAKGYRVHTFPYSLLNNQYYYILNKNSKGEQNGDPFKTLREQYPNYDVIITNVFNRPMIQLCCPQLMKDYYAVEKHYSYPKHNRPLDSYKRTVGDGLAFSEGKQWKRKRAVFNKVFNFDFIKSQTYRIAEISDKYIKRAEKDRILIDQKSNQKYIQIDILENVLIQIFSQVMLNSFLGMSTEEKIQGKSIPNFIKQLMDDSIASGFQLASLLFGMNLMKLGLRSMDRSIKRRVNLYKKWAVPFIKNKIQKIELELKNNPEKTQASDIIQALIMEKYKQNTQQILYEEQILDEFFTFFFAGTQTTSCYVQMMINTIAKHPTVEHKLRQQISKYMSTEDYSYENLKKLVYIDDIQKEITRLYGPALFLFWRVAKQDNYLGQLPVKKGTILSVVTQGNHLSEKYFNNPNQFRPERWDEQCKDLPPFVLGGFSFGARSCIGKHLAMIESKIALVKFMKRYKRIILPKDDFKFLGKFVLCTQKMITKLIISQ